MIVNVSSLDEYEFCPRSVYFSGFLKCEPRFDYKTKIRLAANAIVKELGLRRARILKTTGDIANLGDAFESELRPLIARLPLIYKNETEDSPRFIEDVRLEAYDDIAGMLEKLEFIIGEIGIKAAIEYLIPHRVNYPLFSGELRLSGRIDMVVKRPAYVPLEIKPGDFPERKVFEGHRLQICGYVMLLERDMQEEIECGLVEYTRIQEERPVVITDELRGRVLDTRDGIARILDGKLPDICPHGNGRKCENCGFGDVCYDT